MARIEADQRRERHHFTSCLSGARIVRVRVVDLSHHYEDGMPLFPGLPDPSFKPIANVENDGYAMSEYHLLNHIGTHVDAPAHQIAGTFAQLNPVRSERGVSPRSTAPVARTTAR